MILSILIRFKFISIKFAKISGKIKSSERYRGIFLTGTSAAIVKLLTTAINLVSIPLTVNYLGSERYGLWMAISSAISLMTFADLGLGSGLVNEVAKAKSRNDENFARTAISSTFFILLFISAILLFVFLLVYPFISWSELFNLKTSIAISESHTTIFVLALVFLVSMPLGIIQRIQDGYQEGYVYQFWSIIGSIVSLIFLFLCIHFQLGLPWLVLGFSAGNIIASFANGFILFAYKKPKLFPRFNSFNLNEGIKLIKAGSSFFILGVFTLLANSSDNIIIANTIGISQVAGYEIVKKIFLFSMMTQFIIQPLWPAFAEALEGGDLIWAEKTLKRFLKLTTIATAIISLPLLIFGKVIINYWIGPSYVPSWDLLIGFYFFSIFASYSGVMSTFLNSGHFISKQTLMIVLSSITAIVLKYYLLIQIGVSGAIWATLIGYSVFFVFPSYALAGKYLKEGFKKLQ
jgi:O-antigen/teichoic acid export membrane protein